MFYKELDRAASDDATDDGEPGRWLVARASHVFNAAQIEGFVASEETLPNAPAFDPIANAERFAASSGARIEVGGDRACFISSLDLIRMPERRRFTGTETTTPADCFSGTLCHELVHWSGAKPRLDRDLSGRFGSEAYAMDELVAELGAAFLCSDLAVTPQQRIDDAQYVASWPKVLKNDKRAIFTVASKASEAANWLLAASRKRAP